jgi:hypothetical protein
LQRIIYFEDTGLASKVVIVTKMVIMLTPNFRTDMDEGEGAGSARAGYRADSNIPLEAILYASSVDYVPVSSQALISLVGD